MYSGKQTGDPFDSGGGMSKYRRVGDDADRTETSYKKYTLQTKKLPLTDWKDERTRCLDIAQVIVTITLENSIDQHTPTVVGECKAYWITMKMCVFGDMKSSVWDDMADVSPELGQMARDLFTRNGELKRDYVDHPVKMGSGIWTILLDGIHVQDGLMFIKSWETNANDKLYIGKILLNNVLEVARYKMSSAKFLVSDAATYTVHDTLEINPEDRFRDLLGFCRVGSSDWFAWTKSFWDCNTGEDDYDLSMPELRHLHDTIGMNEDVILEMYKQHQTFVVGSRKVLPEGSVWRATDSKGNNFLYLAATSCHLKIMGWLRKQDPVLVRCQNNRGETPLEALLSDLEDIRTTGRSQSTPKDISIDFKGFTPEAVKCLLLLKESTTKGLMADKDKVCARLKYGCTCGRCIEGFLSPNTSSKLLSMTDSSPDILSMCSYDFQGYYYVFKAFRMCLSLGLIPYKQNVVAKFGEIKSQKLFHEEHPYAEFHTDLTFRIENVGEYIFKAAQFRYGEDFRRPLSQDSTPCRNDWEFGFVCLMCGYSIDHSL